MRVLIVRHAEAVEAGDGLLDEDRPLTPRGVRRMTRAARGIARVMGSLDAIYASPLLRANQTAQLLAEAFASEPRPRVAQVLAPGTPAAEIAGWLQRSALSPLVALVGHEPNCSELLAYLTSRDSSLDVEFKKGAAALVSCTPESGTLRGRLLWHASPSLLRLAGTKQK